MCEIALAWSHVPTSGVRHMPASLCWLGPFVGLTDELWLGCVWLGVWITGVPRIFGMFQMVRAACGGDQRIPALFGKQACILKW